MRQPDKEKGGPIDNPTGDPMPEPSIFTDGNNYANYFVRELYLGFNWEDFSKQYDGLYLYCAVLNGTSTAPSIYIAPRKGKGKNAVYYQIHGLTAMHCSTNGVVKLEGDGMLAGMEAYIVADWPTVWSLPASKTGLKDGKILFEAKINTTTASNLANSPKINRYFNYEINRVYSNLPTVNQNDFTSEKPNVPTSTEKDVTNWGDFYNEIKSKDDVTLVLHSDIFMDKRSVKEEYNPHTYPNRSLYNIQSGKTVRIIGKGFKIFEYGSIHKLVMRKCANGRKEAEIQPDKIYNEAFTDKNGEVRNLAQSDVYEAVGWEERTGTDPNGAAYTEAYGIKVPENFKAKLKGGGFDRDNVYVWLLVSWTRTLHKVSNYENGTIYFEKDSLNGLNSSVRNSEGKKIEIYDKNLRLYGKGSKPWMITAKPTFFLVNTTMDDDGILIKGGKVSCPESYPELFRCEVEYIFNVEKGATLFIENTVLCGGKAACIRNCGTLCMEECEVTNPLGKGVYTTGKAVVERCLFHDIRLDGVYQVAEDRERWTPESPGEDWPRMSVVSNVFRNIGHYGLNSFAVKNDCVAYIARNQIVDANYGGIWTGNNSNFINEYKDKGTKIYGHKGKAFLPAFMGLVEYNHIYFTDSWVERRKLLGFQDSGGIYIAPNNGRAVVRFNRLERCGGRHMNKAIYGDDGPYNAEVYCNIVSGTENDYDIDFRDMSAEPKSNQHAKITGTFVNTCNTICLNYCEGFVRIKDNNHDTIPEAERRQLLCDFKYNAVMRVKGKSNDPTAPTKNDIAYKEGYVYDVAIFNSGFANILNNFISEKINANSKN